MKKNLKSRNLLETSKFIAFLFAGVFLSQCSTTSYLPTEADAQRAGTSLDALLASRVLYTEKCSKCHSLPQPEKYTSKAQWEKAINKMQSRAKINDEQKQTIMVYLTSKCTN